MTQPAPPEFTLPPPSEDNYSSWIYQWLEWPLDTEAIPARSAAALVGYVHTEVTKLECRYRGKLQGFRTEKAIVPPPIECPDLITAAGADYDLHSLAISFWGTVTNMAWLPACSSSAKEMKIYPPELSMTLREYGPDGPIARDQHNEFVRYDMVAGKVVYANAGLLTGWRNAREDSIPPYFVVVENLFSPAIWVGVSVSALFADQEYSGPPAPPPPKPPPVNFAPPMPACGVIAVPSTVTPGAPHTGVVAL